MNPIKYAYVYIYISIYIHRYTYSQRYIKYTLVYSSNLLAYLFHVHLRHSFKTAIFSRFLKVAIATSSFMNKFYNDVAIVTFKNLLKMAVLNECLNKMDMEKVGKKFWVMYQCILNVPLWNDWSKVTHSQVHGSQLFKLFYYKVSNKFLQQDSKSSYIFRKIQM